MTLTFDDAKLVLGIGAPRTGTRWMSEYFAAHPEILMSPIRVLHYFDTRFDAESAAQYNALFRERLDTALARPAPAGAKRSPNLANLRDRVRMIDDDSAYIDFFRKRWSGEKAFSDITPGYWQMPPAAFEMMLKAHKHVRFIFVMRNPIDRFWSSIRLKHTRDAQVDVLEQFDRRTRGGPKDKDTRQDYQATIERLESVVPASAIKYFFFETLFNMQSIEELCNFLGVKTVPAPVETPVNQSSPIPLDPQRRRTAFEMFEADYHFLSGKFGGKLPARWLDDLKAFSNA